MSIQNENYVLEGIYVQIKKASKLNGVNIDKKKYFLILFVGIVISAVPLFIIATNFGLKHTAPSIEIKDLLCIFSLLVMVTANVAI
ncbi:hypothetical protein [Tepidanaerobacter syntrophicus]|uniref:hypothetical protein n=1 Tax=Tepidanaerobacter syntrophicus TaxID=224999 RepID=UPI002352CF67|nr:hypothetical protein [Tepidanaerobacter syntrophicus]